MGVEDPKLPVLVDLESEKRNRHGQLFKAAAALGNTTVSGLKDLPIDELESLVRKVDSNIINIDRLKMRVALLNHIETESP